MNDGNNSEDKPFFPVTDVANKTTVVLVGARRVDARPARYRLASESFFDSDVFTIADCVSTGSLVPITPRDARTLCANVQKSLNSSLGGLSGQAGEFCLFLLAGIKALEAESISFLIHEMIMIRYHDKKPDGIYAKVSIKLNDVFATLRVETILTIEDRQLFSVVMGQIG